MQQMFSNSVDGRSVARKLSALRHLYKFLLLDEVIKHDPTLNIDSPKQWKVLPKALARDEVDFMLHRESDRSPAIALRNRAMLEVFYAGALRVSEIVGVKLEDLKLDLGYLMVRGKGDKERIVPLGRSAQVAVSAYLKDSRTAIAQGRSSPFLFVGRGAKPLTRQRVWQMVRESSNSGRHASPHMLRHSCATHMVENGARPSHGADHSRPFRYFDDAGLHARRARSFEECLSETPSAGEGAMTAKTPAQKATLQFLASLRQRNASVHTLKAYRGDLEDFLHLHRPTGFEGCRSCRHSRISFPSLRQGSRQDLGGPIAGRVAFALSLDGARRHGTAESRGAGFYPETSQEASARPNHRGNEHCPRRQDARGCLLSRARSSALRTALRMRHP